MTTDRIRALEEARSLALSGRYDAALRAVDKLLLRDCSDLDALRLKGNVLDLQVSDELLGLDAKFKSLKVARSR